MNRALLRLLKRIDAGDYVAVKPAVKMLREQGYEKEAEFASRQKLVGPDETGVTGPQAMSWMNKTQRWEPQGAEVWMMGTKQAAMEKVCRRIVNYIQPSSRQLKPDTYQLRTDLDLPLILEGSESTSAMVDYLQEVVKIDLGNLLWLFAQAKGNQVEWMQKALALWLRCQEDEKASDVEHVRILEYASERTLGILDGADEEVFTFGSQLEAIAGILRRLQRKVLGHFDDCVKVEECGEDNWSSPPRTVVSVLVPSQLLPPLEYRLKPSDHGSLWRQPVMEPATLIVDNFLSGFLCWVTNDVANTHPLTIVNREGEIVVLQPGMGIALASDGNRVGPVQPHQTV